MRLIIGIGNPGKEYEGTRHNVGYEFLDWAEKKDELKATKYAKTDVFVNLSGGPVKKLKTKLKIKNDQLILAHDDLDIPFGSFKLSYAKDSAGHRGVQSVIDALKTNKFWRLRIGTSSPRLRSARTAKDKHEAVARFVLSKFSPSEHDELKKIFKEALARIRDNLHHA